MNFRWRRTKTIAVWRVALGCAASGMTAPVPIIFDTDRGTDVDEAGALAILDVLADRGEARILATMSANRNRWSAPALEIINTSESLHYQRNVGSKLIQERTAGGTPMVTYTRGTGFSGNPAGAGGIGGLPRRSYGYSGATGNWSAHHYDHADGGGNVTCLISAGQTVAATYRYDPFGAGLPAGPQGFFAGTYKLHKKYAS